MLNTAVHMAACSLSSPFVSTQGLHARMVQACIARKGFDIEGLMVSVVVLVHPVFVRVGLFGDHPSRVCGQPVML